MRRRHVVTVDLGIVYAGERTQKLLEIFNKRKSPITVKFLSACDCHIRSNDVVVVGPGATGKVALNVLRAGLGVSNVDDKIGVKIIGRDTTETIYVKIHVRVLPSFDVRPSWGLVRFGTKRDDIRSQKAVRISITNYTSSTIRLTVPMKGRRIRNYSIRFNKALIAPGKTVFAELMLLRPEAPKNGRITLHPIIDGQFIENGNRHVVTRVMQTDILY